MHRILLADDDTIVRLYLTDIVKWEQYDLEVVGVARDGDEALKMAVRLQPDVVLTDISMPKLDGVELIRQLRTGGFDGVIDVLSCHDDFELVKQAMKEGADDYLLKNHLNDQSIADIVHKINEQIEGRQRQSRQHRNLQTLASKGRKVIRRELLSGLLRGTLTDQNLEEQLTNAELYGKYRRLITVSIRPLCADKEQMDMLLTLCEQRMKQEPAEALHFREDTLILLIDLTDEPSARKAAELCNRLQNLIQRLTEQYLNLDVAMAASAICEGKTAIADSLRQANMVQENSFYGAGRWQFGVNAALSSELPKDALSFVEKLPVMLEEDEASVIRENYAHALEEICQARVHQGCVISWLRDCDAAADIRRAEAKYAAIRRWEDCADWVDDYLSARDQKQESRIPENAGPTIRRAVQYITMHFHEPISLPVVSQQVNLTAPYFSTLFKQEMGIGFSEFLTTLRMEWVCERMKTTRLTIKQISEDAGFPDYPYFCKTFKKTFGISPAAYRKQNS